MTLWCTVEPVKYVWVLKKNLQVLRSTVVHLASLSSSSVTPTIFMSFTMSAFPPAFETFCLIYLLSLLYTSLNHLNLASLASSPNNLTWAAPLMSQSKSSFQEMSSQNHLCLRLYSTACWDLLLGTCKCWLLVAIDDIWRSLKNSTQTCLPGIADQIYRVEQRADSEFMFSYYLCACWSVYICDHLPCNSIWAEMSQMNLQKVNIFKKRETKLDEWLL